MLTVGKWTVSPLSWYGNSDVRLNSMVRNTLLRRDLWHVHLAHLHQWSIVFNDLLHCRVDDYFLMTTCISLVIGTGTSTCGST